MNTYNIMYINEYGNRKEETVEALDANEAIRGLTYSSILEVECIGAVEEPCEHSDHDGHCCLICGAEIHLYDLYDEDYGKDR